MASFLAPDSLIRYLSYFLDLWCFILNFHSRGVPGERMRPALTKTLISFLWYRWACSSTYLLRCSCQCFWAKIVPSKCVSVYVSLHERLSAYLYFCIIYIFKNLLYSILCVSLVTKTLTSSHIFILASTHYDYIHMISSNILMDIFMQVFGVFKSYKYTTYLSTHTPTRCRANHSLVVSPVPVGYVGKNEGWTHHRETIRHDYFPLVESK